MQPNLEGPALETPQVNRYSQHTMSPVVSLSPSEFPTGEKNYIWERAGREGRETGILAECGAESWEERCPHFTQIVTEAFDSAQQPQTLIPNTTALLFFFFFCGYRTITVMMQQPTRITIKGRIAYLMFNLLFSILTTTLMPCCVKQIGIVKGKRTKECKLGTFLFDRNG